MEYYNIAKECTEMSSTSKTNLKNTVSELKNHWKGTAATKFFSVQEEIITEMDKINNQISMLLVVTSLAKELETIIEEIEKLEKIKAGLTEQYSSINAKLMKLKKEKADLVSRINTYLGDIANNKINLMSVLSANTFQIKNDSKFNLKIPITDNTIAKEETAKKEETIGKELNEMTKKYSDKVGVQVANISNYNNSAAKGQCVWYVRGRAMEKFGKDTGAIGNGSDMYTTLKNRGHEAAVPMREENLKADMIASYGLTYASNNPAGHVIYIEEVDKEKGIVYYTEGGTAYTTFTGGNGTTGKVKTATIEQIINGGSPIGLQPKGLIDVTKLT